MLQASRFQGSSRPLIAAASEFCRDFSTAISPLVLDVDGTLATIARQRLIALLDTDAQHLRKSGYICRTRRAPEQERPEVTLKFRHPDRYVAEGRQMKSRIPVNVKFEEDIKAPFVSLYSFSACGMLPKKTPAPATLGDLTHLFPDLPKRLGDVDGQLTLNEVNGFSAREVVITGATVQLGSKPKARAECALIVWYDQQGSPTDPAAVEFSYRYGNATGVYGGKVARRAFEIFATVQSDLTEWLDPTPRTKTAFVYG
jgi:hypothetical protein